MQQFVGPARSAQFVFLLEPANPIPDAGQIQIPTSMYETSFSEVSGFPPSAGSNKL